MSHTNACEKLFKRRKMELFEEAIVEESLGEKIKMVNELTRNIFFLLTIIFCALAFGQKPTVAIMVNDNKITDKSKKLSAGTYDQLHGEIEEYIDSKYAIFDRSDDVQKFLMKEHEYQRSGAVSDSTIKALGEQFGVQWLGIISVNWSIDKYHLQARLTDIVTRRSKTVNTTSSLKSNGEITSAAKEIANKLLGVADSKSMGGATPPSDGSRGSSAGFRDDKVGLDMIFVQGGTFTMGCTSEQGSDCWDDEKPAHNVTVSDYYIGKFPVTQRQWVAVMGSNPSHFKGDDLPVENVSWTDIQGFISKLRQVSGKRYRLLTEAEWEYAARGGSKSKGFKYAGGNRIADVAWYEDNSGAKTHPVGLQDPNELGIHDMSGNVYEWVSDWFGSYSSGSKVDPAGPSSGSYRVLRGGSWYSNARYCRVANRNDHSPGNRGNGSGFRLALSP